MKPCFVPRGYEVLPTSRVFLWRRARASQRSVVESEVDDLLQRTERILHFRISCPLHVIEYHSNEAARSSLGRQFSGTHLLAPLQSAELSLIACQSVAAHPSNGDPRRMRRHLAHEIGHVAAALRTGSRKTLGDGNVGMRLRSWVNEGFAECLASLVANRPDVVERTLARATDLVLGPDELDEAFHELDSEHRATAAAIATRSVWRGIQRHGVHHVFAHLDEPTRWQA